MALRGKQEPDVLHLTHDRKVSPKGWWQAPNGKRKTVVNGRWVATIPNSFGLPAGTTCPGKTDFCFSCYAMNNERGYPIVHQKMMHNFDMLTHQVPINLMGLVGTVYLGKSITGMEHYLSEMVDRFIAECKRINLSPEKWLFRIHWDGDFFSLDYARAWCITILKHPEVKFWAYTRSFVGPVDVVPILADIENLALYLSADEYNIDAALDTVATFPTVLLALCAEDYASGRRLAPDSDAIPCPENNNRIPLMGPDKKEPGNGIGACVTCRLCPDSRRDILFSTSHKEDIRNQPVLIGPPRRITATTVNLGPCRNPDCGRTLVRSVSRGRNPEYCDKSCRNHAAYLRRTNQERQGVLC